MMKLTVRLPKKLNGVDSLDSKCELYDSEQETEEEDNYKSE